VLKRDERVVTGGRDDGEKDVRFVSGKHHEKASGNAGTSCPGRN
jgi:hypothetical protein